MALAATLRPRGRLRSVMAKTILGLDMVDTFTSSETCKREDRHKLRPGREPPELGQGDAHPWAMPVPWEQHLRDEEVMGTGLTMVKGMNWRMLPRLPCSRQSTHSSMNHWTNWVWVPAVLAPRMEEMSRKRFAVERSKRHRPGWAGPSPSSELRGAQQHPSTAGAAPSAKPCPWHPTLPSTLFRGSLMLTLCSWEAEREVLMERSGGEESRSQPGGEAQTAS